MSTGNQASKKIVISYGNALFLVAKEKNIIKKIQDDLEKIRRFFLEHPQAKKILSSPLIRIKEQDMFINLIIAELKISKEVKNLLILLLENSRLKLIYDVIDYYILLAVQEKGEKFISITTSQSLLKKTRDYIKNELEKIFKCKIYLVEKVKSNILGGIIIIDGTKMYDASIKSKLTIIERLAKQQIYSI